MALADRVVYWLNAQTYGGVLAEALFCAVERAPGLWAGIEITWPDGSVPRVRPYRDHVEDTALADYVRVSRARAERLCPALPLFVDALDALP